MMLYSCVHMATVGVLRLNQTPHSDRFSRLVMVDKYRRPTNQPLAYAVKY